MKQRVAFFLGLAAVIAYLLGLGLEQSALCAFAKPVPLIVLIAWVAGAPRTGYRDLMLTGLVLSLVGDVFLAQDQSFFLQGLAYFLCAHLAYVSASFTTGVPSRWALLLPFVGWCALVFYFMHDGLGEMLVPVTAYMLVICVMMWRAACAWGVGAWGSWTTLGALLFGISDSLLALDLFHGHFRGAAVAVMLTYWAGQTLLAGSVRRFKPQ